MKILFIADGCHPGTQGGIQTFGRALKKMFRKNLVFLSDYLIQRNRIIYDVRDNTEVGYKNLFYRGLNKLSFNFIKTFFKKNFIKKINPDICMLRLSLIHI